VRALLELRLDGGAAGAGSKHRAADVAELGGGQRQAGAGLAFGRPGGNCIGTGKTG
jgi:hypothetical protein